MSEKVFLKKNEIIFFYRRDLQNPWDLILIRRLCFLKVVFSEIFLKLTPNPPTHLQLLKNIFRVCWKWKNTDIICYIILTSLVSLSQGNVKKSKKLIKLNETSSYCRRKSPYLLDDLWNFNEIFRNDVAYDNSKSHTKKTRNSLSL